MSTVISVHSDSEGEEIPTAKRPGTDRPYLIPNWVLKVTMAVTGTIFVGFVVFHMAGNLKVYLGAEDFDHYAHWLRTIGNPLIPGETFLWIFRGVLALCLVLHVCAGIAVWVRAAKARGRFPRKLGTKRFSARSMIWVGLILLFFIMFHILDLTVGAPPASSMNFVAGSAYDNLVYSFQRPLVSIFYIITMFLLAFHMSHGIWSIVNDLGGTGKRLRSLTLIVGGLLTLIVVLGNMSIPIAVLTGLVTI